VLSRRYKNEREKTVVAQHIDTLILARFVKYKCMQWHAYYIWMAITMVATSRHLIMYKSHNPQILWDEIIYSSPCLSTVGEAEHVNPCIFSQA
jgi:hypothetical protein